MMEGRAYLRERIVASVQLRLTVAMLFGGFIGLERERKRRPAGTTTSGSWRRSPSWRASTPLMKSEGGAEIAADF